jgi:doublecortin-like kinase 3
LFILGYSFEVDCWATGIILYILLCGYPPFKTADRNQEALFQLIQRGKFVYDVEYWSAVSASKIVKIFQFSIEPLFVFFSLSLILDAKNLIDHLLVVDRHKRMRADEILLHPWIMSIGQSKTIRNMEEYKTTLRLKYETKIKEYAAESTGP